MPDLVITLMPNSELSGICSRHEVTNSQAGFPGNFKQSLNTGIVNLNKYGRRLTNQVSSKIFLHEIGHSFGAKVIYLDF